MNPFLTNSQAQYSQGQPLSPIGGPVFVDSERLLIEYKLAPPLDLRGYYHDGIEFYSCIRKDCKSVWAAQWNPTPRNRKISGTVTMATYKSLSVPKSCDKCKRTITASDKERQKKYEAYKVRIEEHTVMAARQKREREFAHDLVGIWQGSQTPTVPMAAASVTGTSKGDYNSVPAVTVDRQANTAVNYLDRHRKEQDSKPAAVFEEVPLSPPPPVFEDPAELAITDPSWDVVDEEDANEDWAIINHFGSVAIQHRDAHVDTPTVRP